MSEETSEKNQLTQSLDLEIGGHTFTLRTNNPEGLKEAAELVEDYMDRLHGRNKTLSTQNTALLAALAFAEESLESQEKLKRFQTEVFDRAEKALHWMDESILQPNQDI